MPLAYTASGSDAVLYPQHSDIPLISVPNPSSSSQDNTTTIYTKNQNSAVYSSQYYQQSIPLSQQQQQYSQKILQYQPPYPTTAQARSNPSISDALLLALRRRPTARLFRALFQYIPIRDSPNENPHLELPLQAGDYILVHGEMDEDQFYRGETLEGEKGLIPSNYVERVDERQLLLNASRAPSPSFPLNIPQHLTKIQHDFSTSTPFAASTIAATLQSSTASSLPDSVCPYPPVDVTKVTVQEVKITDNPRG